MPQSFRALFQALGTTDVVHLGPIDVSGNGVEAEIFTHLTSRMQCFRPVPEISYAGEDRRTFNGKS